MWCPYNGKGDEDDERTAPEPWTPLQLPRGGLARSVPTLCCLTVASLQHPLADLLQHHSRGAEGSSPSGRVPHSTPSTSFSNGGSSGRRGRGGGRCVVVVGPHGRRGGGGWSGGGGCTGVQCRGSVASEQRLSPQGLCGASPCGRAVGLVWRSASDASRIAIRGRRVEVLDRVGIWRGAPLERPLTQRLARGLLPN